MRDEEVRVVLLLPRDGIEHRQRNVARERLGGRQPAGLRDEQIARMHIVGHAIREKDELRRLGERGIIFLKVRYRRLLRPVMMMIWNGKLERTRSL